MSESAEPDKSAPAASAVDKPAPAAAAPVADEPVPKLPRGRGLKFSGPELFRIALTLLSLVGVIVLARPCASSVSNFVMGYSDGSGASKLPKPDNVTPPAPPQDLTKYEHLQPNMTDEELKAAVERSKARNADSGSAAGSNEGSASNAGSATSTGSASNAGSHAGSAAKAGSASSAP